MAFDAEDVHEAIATQLETNLARAATGVTKDITVRAYPFSGAELPRIEVWPAAQWVEYWGTFGASGVAFVNGAIRIELETANGETWLKQASELVSVGTGKTNSVIDAIMADTTLGGVAETITIDEAEWDDSLESFGQVLVFPFRVALRKSGATV